MGSALITPDGAYELSQDGRVQLVSADDDLAAKVGDFFTHDPDELRKRISEIRYSREIGGISVGSQPVSTHRDEMPIWLGMLLDLSLRPGATTEFEYKPRNGSNTTLTVQQVQRCYECFAWYVQACFAAERYLIGLLDSGTPLTQIYTMLDGAWPQTHFDEIA